MLIILNYIVLYLLKQKIYKTNFLIFQTVPYTLEIYLVADFLLLPPPPFLLKLLTYAICDLADVLTLLYFLECFLL